MAKQTINIGASPNDGTGTPLRTAFDYTNQNFTELYTATGPSGNNIVVPGNATITGDLTVDTSTLKVDSANNRVGIGTTSPDATLDVTSAGTASTYTVSAVIQDGTYPASGYPTLEFNGFIGGNGYRSGIGSIGGQQLAFYIPSTFGVAPSLAMTLNATGNLAFPTGKGIDFSAVTGGTGTATGNVLNDYEEGTFTPTVIGTTTAGTIGTYYAQTGRYTKVGRLVTVQVYLGWGSGTGTGDLAFAGLPFTNGSIPNNYASSTIGYFDNFALTASNVPSMYISPNSSRCDLYQFPVGGGSTTPVPYDVNAAIMFTATYFTA